MQTRVRDMVTLLVALLVATSVDFEAIFHAHDDWALELRAHELSQIESASGCDRSPHWDRSRSERHGACVACLVTAGGAARPAVAARLPEPSRPRIARAAADLRLTPTPHSAARRGRSPPPFLSPAI